MSGTLDEHRAPISSLSHIAQIRLLIKFTVQVNRIYYVIVCQVRLDILMVKGLHSLLLKSGHVDLHSIHAIDQLRVHLRGCLRLRQLNLIRDLLSNVHM